MKNFIGAIIKIFCLFLVTLSCEKNASKPSLNVFASDALEVTTAQKNYILDQLIIDTNTIPVDSTMKNLTKLDKLQLKSHHCFSTN